MDLFNKSILITGGSEGLGFALAKQLLAEGAYVLICGRSQEKLDKAEKLLDNTKLTTFRCDITDYFQVDLMAKNIAKLDILINNAGIYLEAPLANSSPPEISSVIDTNLKGLIHTTKACLPMLGKRSESFIVNIASTKALEPAENLSIYCASKYAVHGFSESLKLELKESNVKVFSFYPPSMSTNFHTKTGVAKDKSVWMTPEQAAEVIVFALTRKAPLTFDQLLLRNK